MAEVDAASVHALKRELLRDLRTATLIVLLDTLDLRRKILSSNLPSDTTLKKVLAAARSLGIVSGEPPAFASKWTAIAASHADWQDLVSIIRHQTTYLSLAGDCAGGTSPKQQLATDPAAYAGFLKGVAHSHREHARFVTGLRTLKGRRRLVDLGGGFGTFSFAWADARNECSAVIMDLPGVAAILPPEIAGHPRLSFQPVDLEQMPEQLPKAEAYILANVLHLLPTWRRVIAEVAERMPCTAVLAVMEAIPDDDAGSLFDLQVHLRSGLVGGLLCASEIETALQEAGLIVIERQSLSPAPDDYFDRHYLVLVGAFPEVLSPIEACV